MKKRILALIIAMIAVMCFTACGSSSTESEPADTSSEQVTEEAAEEPAEVDVNAITTDAESHTVSIYAQVNGTFFDQSTMHCVVNKDGGAGDKAMFAAYCSPQDFYDAMVAAGGEPWNTTDAKIADGEFTDGQNVNITFTWDGQDTPVPLYDMIKTADGKAEVDMRFSGNQANNVECGSGCIACLNSCWAGITSNAAYGFGAIDSGNPLVYLDDTVAPADGTVVLVTFTLE